jgi:hypothetical protein
MLGYSILRKSYKALGFCETSNSENDSIDMTILTKMIWWRTCLKLQVKRKHPCSRNKHNLNVTYSMIMQQSTSRCNTTLTKQSSKTTIIHECQSISLTSFHFVRCDLSDSERSPDNAERHDHLWDWIWIQSFHGHVSEYCEGLWQWFYHLPILRWWKQRIFCSSSQYQIFW